MLRALLVPQGMACAELAGLPAITGLFTSILCLLGHAAAGPSRILVLGPDSSLGPMIAATLLPILSAGGRTSGSRTAVAEQAGARTQLTGVAGAGVIVIMLVLAPGLLKNLPTRRWPRW